ncbi:cytoplasmic dynein 2 intermediate chain 1-like isoform X4 [Clytia hemisphaerica]|uniref:cytoplasmic dynein 2 intermediate chain 1-like isoform X4 n=1 Tax=Clytia hemisphaerica TaxID=252671 RepID=UPI0034D46FD5
MPSGRSKEDTWKEDELKQAIRGDSKERKHKSRDKDKETKESKSRDKDRDKSSKRDKDKDKDRENRKKSRAEVKRGTKKKERNDDEHRSKDKDKERKHRDKDRDRDKDRERRKEKERRSDDKDLDRKEKKDRNEEKDDRKQRDRKDRKKSHKEDDDKENHRDRKDKERSSNHKEGDDREKRKERDGSSKDRDGSSKDRKHRESSSKDRKDRESSSKERRDGDGSSKERKDRDGNSKDKRKKSKDSESDLRRKQREKEKELQRLREIQEIEEKRRKEEEATAAAEYDYEDDFDDYEDDDFESDVEESEQESEQEENESEDEVENKEEDAEEENDVSSASENHSSLQDGIVPQQSFLQLTQQEKAGMQESSSGSSSKKSKTKGTPKFEEKKAHGKINFVAASKKQMSDKVAQKTKKRGEELLGLVQLDVRSIDLFDMPPMTEYELYMKRFGSSDSRQMYTQTNEENFDQECQTDDIETETRWCQHSSDSKSAGTQKSSGDSTLENSNAFFNNTDSVRLNKFLLKASKVCLSLLEEIAAGIEQPRKHYVETRSNLSEGYVSLGSSEFLVLGRDVCDIKYSPSQTNMLLTAHGTSNVVQKGLKSSKGLLCVWNTNDPNKPTRLLVCESVPKSCCFGGVNTAYAIAGMEDGVIAIWDLTEPTCYHEAAQIGNHMLTFQNVTFTTAALEVKHIFPVVAITPLTFYSGTSQADISFQLATMDQSASVHVWTVVRTQIDNLSEHKNVTDDLGLAPHGRVKLVHSTAITPPGVSVTSFTHLFSMTSLKVNEANPNDMYAGTGSGEILHMTRFSNRPTPRLFRQGEGSNKVNSIDINPWKMPYMLACYDDGCVRLFHVKTEDALMTWANTTSGASLLHVQWSRSRPSVFFTMDSDSVLYIWNLLESDVAPIHQMKIQRKDKRAVSFTLANDYAAMGKGSPGRPSEMALIFGDGSVEIHRLTKKLFTMQPDELDAMDSFLANIT